MLSSRKYVYKSNLDKLNDQIIEIIYRYHQSSFKYMACLQKNIEVKYND